MSGGGGSPNLGASRYLDLEEHGHLNLEGSRGFNLEWRRGMP